MSLSDYYVPQKRLPYLFAFFTLRLKRFLVQATQNLPILTGFEWDSGNCLTKIGPFEWEMLDISCHIFSCFINMLSLSQKLSHSKSHAIAPFWATKFIVLRLAGLGESDVKVRNLSAFGAKLHSQPFTSMVAATQSGISHLYLSYFGSLHRDIQCIKDEESLVAFNTQILVPTYEYYWCFR